MRLPSHRRIRQVKSVVANHPSGFFDLAASPRQPLAVAAWPTSPRKTRVRGFRRRASGQTSRRRRCRAMFTPGSRPCGYKTVSGRHEWPNRDPIHEPGFELVANSATHGKESSAERLQEVLNAIHGSKNLYDFVANNPINGVDIQGLGTWTFNVTDNGTPLVAVDVHFTLDVELPCQCTKVVVYRYVRKDWGIPGATGSFAPDGGAGTWDPPATAYAEADSPEGPGIGLPFGIGGYGYHIPWDFDFKWQAICTAGKEAGTTLSNVEQMYHVTGHFSNHGYYGDFY